MAKELPYFKFEPNQWENGNIQICSREDKGLFMDLCSMYWSRLGDVPLKLAIQKLCGGNATAFDSLIEEGIFIVEDGLICIDFLNEQLSEFEDISEKNTKNAKLRWEKYRKQRDECDRNATVLPSQCQNDAIREEKRREEEIKESLFYDFWNLYDKKEGLKKAKKKFMSFSINTQELIISKVPSYVSGTPDKKFRKLPMTYLNGEHWNDELPDYTFSNQIGAKKIIGKSNQVKYGN